MKKNPRAAKLKAGPHTAYSNELLDSIFNNAAVGILLLDCEYNIVDIGRGLSDLLGYTRDELLGANFSRLLHPDLHATGAAALAALDRSDDRSYVTERRYLHKDGSIIWIIAAVSKMALPKEPGQPYFITQITPIDKQKQAEAAAADALKRWEFALQGAGQGIWDYDLVTSEWYFSPTWKRMRGIPEDEEVDGNDADWFELIHPDDKQSVLENIELQNSGERREVAYEYRERHRDGHWIWILARGCCVEYQKNGKPRRVIGTDTDISDLKARELELSTMSQRLELALSTSTVGVWETDLETGAEQWDDRTYEIFGLTPHTGALPPGTWEQMLHPEDRDYALKLCGEAIAERRDYALDYRVVTSAGTIRHIRCKAGFTVDANGHEKMIGVNWDVTADIEHAEALQKANTLAEQRNRELEAARAEMEYASLHDSLTDLPNRRFLDNALEKHARKKGKQTSLALLHIDLDRFKEINDTKGHAAGDAMLRHIAGLLRESVRKDDIVARIGGDEFVVLLSPAPGRERLQSLVDLIIERARQPMLWQGLECRSGVSIGIAETATGLHPRQLLVNADIALYRAKRDGRSRAAYFTDALQTEITSRKQCADDILTGLERNEFVPYFQLQFDARTLDIAGAEALVRWNHPTRGLLTPDQFLDVAEDLHVVGTIDQTILEQSLKHLSEWDRLGLHVPQISVNVSAHRLADTELVKNLRSLDIEPGRVSFELLESIFLDEHDDVISFNIDAIKDLGINIEIDDFGTGHASIVSLLRLKPHRLKIDHQLVVPITESESQQQLVRSIVEIGRSQNIEVCAEGVETAVHADILSKLDCDRLQGYYFARPMPADKLATFARENGWRSSARIPMGLVKASGE